MKINKTQLVILATILIYTGLPVITNASSDDYKYNKNYESYIEYEAKFMSPTTRAEGEASFKIMQDRIRFELEVEDIKNFTKAHIHLGARGEDGPAVVTLTSGLSISTNEYEIRGYITESDIKALDGFDGTLAMLKKRLANGTAYVNVHTKAYPLGEMRGQIFRDNDNDYDDRDDDDYYKEKRHDNDNDDYYERDDNDNDDYKQNRNYTAPISSSTNTERLQAQILSMQQQLQDLLRQLIELLTSRL